MPLQRRTELLLSSETKRPSNLLSLLLVVTVLWSSSGTANAFLSPLSRLVGKGRLSATLSDTGTASPPQVVAGTENIPTWEDLETLAAEQQSPARTPLVTLYRDTNGWCPFCERVWLALEVKQIPYQEQLINLRDKPSWFLQMVPTGLVPAVLFHSDQLIEEEHSDDSDNDNKPAPERSLVWESLDILKALDERFPDTPRLVLDDQEEYMQAREVASKLTTAGVQFLYGGRNGTISEEEKATRKEAFHDALGDLDKFLGKNNGPFCLGGDGLTGVDIEMIPTMERWRHQLPLTANMTIYDETRYPNVAKWFQALEQYKPYYQRVMGDPYSWTAVASTFLRYFATGPDGKTMTESTKVAIERADAAAQQLTESFATMPTTTSYDKETLALARIQAANKLLANHVAIVADCTHLDPKSQTEMPRASDPTVADAALRIVAHQLLTAETDTATMAAAATALGEDAALALKTVAARLCVPRDMGAPAAQILRQTLVQVANDASN